MPGSASRRYAHGSMPKCLHVSTIEYSTAAVRPPTSLPTTPQLFVAYPIVLPNGDLGNALARV
ncbi:unnamed protein product [Gemmata massiliana]|uniref:Uncharacterized protein n=1 Tax=Gemmata massiliana TaxID=1210884 RepID=A0A6P2D496_9BACT|nr:unnamed protein product [Gemmata massiliana]